jgi:uncharacterized protein (DUF58 family)
MDHRPYEPGDDLRYLDWSLLARIGRPFVRRFFAERPERLDLLVDASRSMTLGRPPKVDVACAIAFVFGYLSLTAGERVGATFFAERLLTTLPARRGSAHLSRLLEFLVDLPSGATTNSGSCLGAFAAHTREVGRVILISDLLDGTVESGLASLRRRGFEVSVVRLRSAEDDDPGRIEGSVRVLDIETGARRLLDLTRKDRERYRELRRLEWERTSGLCGQAGISIARLESWKKLPELIFRDLPRWGFLG